MDDTTTTTTAPTLIGYAEAAARWQVSERTIARLVATGEITAHTKPNDRRRRLVDVEEVTAALGPAPVTEHTETITVAEAVTVLLMAIAFDQPGVYHLLRSQLDGDMLDAVALMVGGAGKLAELDAKAGYTDEGDEG